MSQDDYRRAQDLFHELFELGPDERKRVLEERKPSAGVQEILNNLLPIADHGSERSTGVLDQVAQGFRAALGAGELGSAGHSLELEPPKRIGSYKIVRSIGSGGMGVVYEALQESPHRRVALKIIRDPFASPEVLRRFEREASVLARLQHAGIAHIYESHLTDVGGARLPYFAMEYIDGPSLMDYAQERGLSVPDRVALLFRVVDAMQHAHSKGIVHRDLKPANILVVDEAVSGTETEDRDGTSARESDPVGQPKILDFGIARIIDPDLSTSTLQTQPGQVIGTLAYMSPEQLSGDVDAIDPRSDIYSLGVLGYQLLSGRLPFDLASLPLPEAARIVRDEDPPRLSAVDESLRGDLESILTKAMEKDVGRRYATAGELGADLRRYLRDEPILARPATTLYRLRKFSRRNRALVGGVVATFLALLGGITGTSLAMFDAQRERDDAFEAREETKAALQRMQTIANFQASLMDGIDVGEMGKGLIAGFRDELRLRGAGSEETIPEEAAALLARVNGTNLARAALDDVILSRARAELDGGFTDDAMVETALREALVGMYGRFALFDQQQEQLERILELRTDHNGPEHPDTYLVMSRLGVCMVNGGKPEAEAVLREAREGLAELLGPDHPDAVVPLVGLGGILRMKGQMEEAVEIAREVLEARTRSLGPEDELTLEGMGQLASALGYAGRFGEVAEVLEEVLSRGGRALPTDHPQLATSRATLAQLYNREGRHGEAVPLARAATDHFARAVGDDHRQTFVARLHLGEALYCQGEFAEAAAVLERSMGTSERVIEGRPEEHVGTLDFLCRSLCALEEFERLERWAERLFEVSSAVPCPAWIPPRARLLRALSRIGQGLPELAEQDVYEAHRALSSGWRTADRALAEAELGMMLSLRDEDREAARGMLEQSLQFIDHETPPEPLSYSYRVPTYRARLAELARQ